MRDQLVKRNRFRIPVFGSRHDD
ncbi:hypothetical protein PSEUDO8Z_160070 [Pseudomonas sp. 8Z]|nr:hypothetical protein PSEUDO8Z_160070 [Pseudomonas sp. 8Z]